MTSPTLPLTRHRFTVDQFQQMAVAGILAEDDRVELIEGEVVEMAPIGDPHGSDVECLTMLFAVQFNDVASVRVQGPVKLSEFVQVQPDLALLRPRPDFYRVGGAWPENVFLLIEVADTSLRYDREVKAALYARHGIREYWLLDVQERTLTVFRSPGSDGYGEVRTLSHDETITLLAFPDRGIAVTEILGETT